MCMHLKDPSQDLFSLQHFSKMADSLSQAPLASESFAYFGNVETLDTLDTLETLETLEIWETLDTLDTVETLEILVTLNTLNKITGSCPIVKTKIHRLQ
jgi:hypothetical protein